MPLGLFVYVKSLLPFDEVEQRWKVLPQELPVILPANLGEMT